MPEILFINNSQVLSLLSLREAIDAVRYSFIEYSQKRSLMPAKLHFDIPLTAAFLRILPATLPQRGYAGVKIYLDPSYESVHSPAIFLLFKIENGEPIAMIEANGLSQIRTAAASAIATDYLANKDASVVFIAGSGGHARTQLEGTCLVRKVSRAYVFSPNSCHRESFADDMSKKLHLDVVPVANISECAKNSCQIVCLATTSKNPVLHEKDVNSGTHINTIGSSFRGRSEIDPKLILKSRIFVDCFSQALFGVEGSDLSDLIKGKTLQTSDIKGEIGELITGSIPGRRNPSEITIFKNTGMAIWDVACSAIVYEKAKRSRIGVALASPDHR